MLLLLVVLFTIVAISIVNLVFTIFLLSVLLQFSRSHCQYVAVPVGASLELTPAD